MFLSWTHHTCTPKFARVIHTCTPRLPGSSIPIYLLINSSTVRVLPIIFKLFFFFFFSFVFLLDGHFMIPLYPGAHKHYVAPQSTKMSLESPFFYSFLFVFLFIVPILEHFYVTSHTSVTHSAILHSTLQCQYSHSQGLEKGYPPALTPKTNHVLLKTMSVTTCILTSSITSGILQLMHWSRCLQFFTR